jgi:hypothetical protein
VEKNLFNESLFQQLENFKPLYFDESDKRKKAALKQKIDDLIHQLTNGKEKFDFEIYLFGGAATRSGGLPQNRSRA